MRLDGAVTIEGRPRFRHLFAHRFSGKTFLSFLKLQVRRSRRKILLTIDNGPCHNLDDEGKAWLAANSHRIELFVCRPPR